ncbi:hypothetical protein [Myxococcus llanfairpwllgwyngyllgogerychwyrndrobwllllantysiliogogogochensis]|nr:hypothetical protein [Myxococcus llanfairpwllgwyngyllgogerychwyrndrobwllllantysiliogogogochensis]
MPCFSLLLQRSLLALEMMGRVGRRVRAAFQGPKALREPKALRGRRALRGQLVNLADRWWW